MSNIEPKKQESEYEIMDTLDEQQIVSEIKGHVIEQYFYEFQQGGRLVVGISWSGIKYIARKMSEQGHPISVEEVIVNPTDEGYSVSAVAMDLSTKEKRWGAAESSKIIILKSGEERDNPFAMQVAMSKAQRNAIRNFIPETAIQEGYKEWKQRALKQHQPQTTSSAPSGTQAQIAAERAIEPSQSTQELCICGHQKRLHSDSNVCMIGTKEHTQCQCAPLPSR